MTEAKRVLVALPTSSSTISREHVNQMLSFFDSRRVVVEIASKLGTSTLISEQHPGVVTFEEALRRFSSSRERARVTLNSATRPGDFSVTRPRKVKLGALYYFAVLVLSGSDTLEEVNDESLMQLLLEVYLSQGMIGGLSSGQALLANLTAGNRPILEGLKTTCFGKIEGGSGDLERILTGAGANVSFVQAGKPHVVIDGSIITAQNSESAQMMAENCVDRLNGIISL
jgi:putative intracellular protease/amidase